MKCKVCDAPVGKYLFRCDEHQRCDDCGATDQLCLYSEGLLCDPCKTARVQKQIVTFAGETEFTPEIICPYCGLGCGIELCFGGSPNVRKNQWPYCGGPSGKCRKDMGLGGLSIAAPVWIEKLVEQEAKRD